MFERIFGASIQRALSLAIIASMALSGGVSPVYAIEPSNAAPTRPPIAIGDIYRPAIKEAERALTVKLRALSRTDKCAASAVASQLAAYEFAEENFSASALHLNQALKLLSEKCDNYQDRVAHINKHLGDCEFVRDRFSPAISRYELALTAIEKALVEPNTRPDALIHNQELHRRILGVLSDSYIRAKKYEVAVKTLLKLLALQQEDGNRGVGWTCIALKDAYEQLGKKDEANIYFNLGLQAFKPLIEAKVQSDSSRSMKEITELAADALPHDIWEALEAEPESSPVLVWPPPNDEKPWALLVCIHGMGLHKSAFAPFAKIMSERGVLVLALDVRGFGSWSKLDKPKINFDFCASDIKHISAALKNFNPNIPLFLLGESMGGAIALQTGVECDDVDAVISSVPAADRYNGTRTKMKVAWQVLTGAGSNHFDITKDVIEKVSQNEQVVEKWKSDREARFKLGTDELINFETFMINTKSKVQKLTKPVLIAQGGADPLVKPSSTIELYDAIKAVDKTLIVLGYKEHLIFENEQFSPLLLEGLTNWIKGHAAIYHKNAAAAATNSASAAPAAPAAAK